MNNKVKDHLISELCYIRLYKSRAKRLITLMKHGRRYSLWHELNSKGKMCHWELDNQERYDSAEDRYLTTESEVRGFLDAYNMITEEALYYDNDDVTIRNKSGEVVLA